MTPEYDVLKDTTFPFLFTGTDSRRRGMIIGSWEDPKPHPISVLMDNTAAKNGGIVGTVIGNES
jgi:hypothetical protein